MSSELWLVRTFKNQILGPFEREDLIKMIRQGALDVQDEVCPSLGYWIGLHERGEIQNRLGVELPKKRPLGEEDEITENDLTLTSLSERAEHDALHAEVVGKIAVQKAKAVPGIPSFLGKVEHVTLFRVATVVLLGVILWSLYKVFLMLKG